MTDSYPLCRAALGYSPEEGKWWPLNPNKPDCDGQTKSEPGGGIVCPKCGAWFCY